MFNFLQSLTQKKENPVQQQNSYSIPQLAQSNTNYASTPNPFGYATPNHSDYANIPKDIMKPKINNKKKTNPNKAVLAMLVDRSGSMSSMGKEVSAGCNEYLNTQRTNDAKNETSTHVIFSVFSNDYNQLRSDKLEKQPQVTDQEVDPTGGTALYDSIAQLIRDTLATIDEMEEAPGQVGIFILTDGHENQSRCWTKDMVAKQIKLLEGEPYKWQFYFAAANQDAMTAGEGLGMKRDQCIKWSSDSANMKRAFKTSSEAFTRQKCGYSSSYTVAERQSCQSYD